MEHGIIIDGCNPSNWDSPVVVENLLSGKVSAVNATVAIWEGFEETVDVIASWHRRFREQENIVQVRETADIRQAYETGRLGVILGWQNISPIENSIERLEAFHILGVRIVQLAYNVRNLVADGCYESHDSGLSMFGLKAVRKMNELGILIDLSHVGDKSSLDTIEASDHPVAFTHTHLREFYDHPRNKTRDLVRALVEKGGVIGANAYPQFLPSGYDATLSEYVDGLEQLIEVAGIDHVGFATDQCEGHDWAFFDYLARLHGTTDHFTADPPCPNPTVKGLEKNSDIPNIATELSARSYRHDEIDKVMGGNWMRLYAEVWDE